MANVTIPPLPTVIDGCTSTQTHSRRERDDNYWGVIVVLKDRWRVIVDEQGDQFILQRHYADPLHRGVWRGQSYYRNRDSLIAACARLEPLSGPSVTAILSVLPDRIGGKA